MGSSYRIIDGADRVGKQVDLPLLHDDIRKRLERSNCMAHPSVMMRRDLLGETAGPYRPYFPLAEDYDLWLRLAENHRLANLAEPLILYRREAENSNVEKIERQTVSTTAAQWSAYCRTKLGFDPAATWKKNGSDNACQKRARCSAVRRGHSQKVFVRSQVCNIAGMRGAGGAIVRAATLRNHVQIGFVQFLKHQWRTWNLHARLRLSQKQACRRRY